MDRGGMMLAEMQLELPVVAEKGSLYEAMTWTIEHRQCSQATRVQHYDHRRWLCEFFGDVPVSAVNFSAVTRYIESEQARSIRNITIRKRLVTLRMALDDADRRGLSANSSGAWWPRIVGDSIPGRDLWTYDQYRQGRMAFAPAQRIGIDILFWLGMHTSDVRRWRRSDVDFASGKWQRYNTKSKALPKWLPMPGEFAQLLHEWCAAEGIVSPAHPIASQFWHFPSMPIVRACKRADVPRITPLGLRRSCVSYQFELGMKKGMKPEMISEWSALWLGHKGDPKTSDIIRRHYMRWSPDAMTTACPYDLPGVL